MIHKNANQKHFLIYRQLYKDYWQSRKKLTNPLSMCGFKPKSLISTKKTLPSIGFYKIKLSNFILIALLVFNSNLSMAEYSINKHSINSGGNISSGGQYKLSGSIGQVDANSGMSNASYQLNAGFWQNTNDNIFKNGFE